MIKKEHRFQVKITNKMFESLKFLSERLQQSIGQTVRDSIYDYLKKKGLKS